MNHSINITVKSNIKVSDVNVDMRSHAANQFDVRLEIKLHIQTPKTSYSAAPIPPSIRNCRQVMF